jgi:hypothetical protein
VFSGFSLKLKYKRVLINGHFKPKAFLTVKDYSVSQEIFDLYHDAKLDMITTPQPSLENLGKYYESVDYISHTDSKGLYLKSISFCKSIALKKKIEFNQFIATREREAF